jgi:YVTN family beta-propeller protein
LYNNYLYITEQGSYGGSGKIHKADTTGNILLSVDAGTNPYSIAIANNKIYITNGPAGNVSVHKLDDLSFIKNITVGAYPQEILAYNNKVYVANTSIYMGAQDSTISVIDADKDTVITKIIVRKDPSSLAISNDGYLLAGCPGDGDNGKIYRINAVTDTIKDTINIPVYGFGKDLAVDKKSNDLYFISYINNIVKYSANDKAVINIVSSVYPENYFYGYNYESESGKHYILDAKTFTVSGSLSICNNNGTNAETYTTGIAPRRVIFKYTESSTGVNDNPAIAESFSLKQNYPNPFNPSTTIEYSIPETAAGKLVTLKVYDVIGKEMTSLVNEVQAAGNYRINFNASGLSSGVYFYRITAGNFTLTRQMILLK